LKGLERAGDRGRAQVEKVGRIHSGREKAEAVDVVLAQTKTEIVSAPAADICQAAHVADVVKLRLGTLGEDRSVIVSKRFKSAFPFQGIEFVIPRGAWSCEYHRPHLARSRTVRPPGLQTGVLEASPDRRAFSMAHQDLHQLQLQSFWVELPELLIGVGRTWD